MAVIEVSGLVKRFGSTVALDGIDLSVPEGSIVGFLGPNGAGKSTTIRILLGLLRRDEGAVNVLGRDPWSDAVALHERMAYVPGDVALWPNLSGGEAIDVLAGLRGPLDRTRRDELIEGLELDPSKRCGTYSKGNRQKVALIAALCGSAELLVLDEPTSGLDPLMEQVFDQCLLEDRERGVATLLSSHLLSQVEKLCDSLTIIRSGKVVETGTLKQLRHLTRTHVEAVLRTSPELSLEQHGIHDLRMEGETVTFDADAGTLDKAIEALSAAGLTSLTCQPPSLESLFLDHYTTRADT